MQWNCGRSPIVANALMALSILCGASLCRAATPPGSAQAQEHWRALADIDSQAAVALIEDSHPGASVELHDVEFTSLVAAAKQHLSERIPQVIDYPGYRAVMDGLAADFRDGHIWAHPTALPIYVKWTGIVLSRQDHQWVVASQLPIPGKPDVTNARLLSCDALDAESWAKERIALFQGNAQIEAELVNAAPWLLLDEGNPFLKRPSTCVFQRTGEPPVQMALHWGGASQDVIEDAIEKAGTESQVGLAVKTFEDGYWISLGTLKAEAASLVKEAADQQAMLRAAKFVVVDLRGNGGGSSRYAEQLTKILVGEKRVAATDVRQSCSGDYWRASEGNLAARLAARGAFGNASQGPELAEYDATTRMMQDALKAGRAFSPTLPLCSSHAPATKPSPLPALPRSLMKGRLIIITDHSCFSSCLLAVDLFRKVGATQVGEATDISRRYMEVRQIMLPSGLTYFSTLQKVALGEGDFGPYVPDLSFPGRINDSASLRAWVRTVAK